MGPDSEITAASEQGPLWLNLMKPPSAAGCAYILCVRWKHFTCRSFCWFSTEGSCWDTVRTDLFKMCHLGLAGPDLLMDIFSCNLLLELFYGPPGRRLRAAKNWSSVVSCSKRGLLSGCPDCPSTTIFYHLTKDVFVCCFSLLRVAPSGGCQQSPESKVTNTDRLFLGIVWLTQLSFRHEAPVCVTVQKGSADCRWRGGSRCRLAPLCCSSGWCHFLHNKKIVYLHAQFLYTV